MSKASPATDPTTPPTIFGVSGLPVEFELDPDPDPDVSLVDGAELVPVAVAVCETEPQEVVDDEVEYVSSGVQLEEVLEVELELDPGFDKKLYA